MATKQSLRYGNAARPFYKKDDTEKQEVLPHNNKTPNDGRRVRQQHIVIKDKIDPTKVTKKTIFHVNYSPKEQWRIHMIKEAIANNDDSILTKLSLHERKIYDLMMKAKQEKENDEQSNA